jgi:hypothetical protein
METLYQEAEATTDLAQLKQKIAQGLDRANDFLDRYVLPWPVRFLTYRFVILITIGLLIPLLVYAGNTVLVLGINSYLNTMSVAVSSIVLLYATLSEARQKQIAEMQEKRAQEDHAHVTQMHTLLVQMLASRNEEIEELKQALAQMRGETYMPAAKMLIPDLRALHPRGYKRFATNDPAWRWQKQVLQNPLVSAIQKDLES